MKEKKILQEMWKNPRQKAMIKLGIWFCFLLIITMVVTIMNQFSKNTIPNAPSIKEENPVIPNQKEYQTIEELWKDLKEKDYKYTFQLKDLKTEEKTTFTGEKKQGIEEGYRESKLGIIKYRIEKEKIYQIFVDTEEEINNLYEPEDVPYLKLESIKEKIQGKNSQENILGKLKYIVYQLDEERIVITLTQEQCTTFEITTNTKNYKLEFEFQKE